MSFDSNTFAWKHDVGNDHSNIYATQQLSDKSLSKIQEGQNRLKILAKQC